MKRKSYEMDMCNGPILKKMLKYSIPLMFSGVLQLLFNAADIAVVGKFAGDNSLGAVGATASLINLIVNLFIGLSIGANVVVARHYGAKEHERLSKAVHTAVFLAAISGVVLTIIGVIFADNFLILMNTPEGVLPLATLYMRIYFCGMLPSMIYNFGAAILRAVGDTKRPLYYLTIAGIVNVILNLLFVIVFKMDVAGVGTATVISQIISSILVVRCLMKEDSDIKLVLRKIKIHSKECIDIIHVGLPAGLQGCVFALSNVVIQSTINSFGETVVAGSAASGSLEGFVYMAMNTFHQATLSFTSQNYGAGRYERIKKIMLCGMACVTITGLVLGYTEIFFGRSLLRIYSSKSEVIEAGMVRLFIMSCVYFTCGTMDVMVGALRGLGSSVMPMIVSLLGACGLRLLWLATIYKLPGMHSIEVVYWSYPVSWTITTLVHIFCYIIVYRRVVQKKIMGKA